MYFTILTLLIVSWKFKYALCGITSPVLHPFLNIYRGHRKLFGEAWLHGDLSIRRIEQTVSGTASTHDIHKREGFSMPRQQQQTMKFGQLDK